MLRRDVTSVIAVGAAAAHLLAVRSWQLRWGATGEERAATLAGDDLIASRINQHEHAAASAGPHIRRAWSFLRPHGSQHP